MDEQENISDSCLQCPNSGIGTTPGVIYQKRGRWMNSNALDSAVHIFQDGIGMYAVFCGFNNTADVAKYAMDRMVYEIFLSECPISTNMTPERVKEALRTKWNTVVKRYADEVSLDLTERFLFKEGGADERVAAIDAKISGGCTALIVLKIGMDLFVLNCGRSLAIVITGNNREEFSTQSLNESHDNDNPTEIQRLEAINVDPSTVYQTTRALGDLFRTLKYDEKEAFVDAKGPPVISEPEISYRKIEPNWHYLVMVSDGVVQNLRDCSVDDIPMEICEHLSVEMTQTSTAQGLVDYFSRKHLSAYEKGDESSERISSTKREEMTALFVVLQQRVADDTMITQSFNDSTYSTDPMPTVDLGPFEPYVDIRDLNSHYRSQLEAICKGTAHDNVIKL